MLSQFSLLGLLLPSTFFFFHPPPCRCRHDVNDYGSRVALSDSISNLRHLSVLNLFKANIGVGGVMESV